MTTATTALAVTEEIRAKNLKRLMYLLEWGNAIDALGAEYVYCPDSPGRVLKGITFADGSAIEHTGDSDPEAPRWQETTAELVNAKQ